MLNAEDALWLQQHPVIPVKLNHGAPPLSISGHDNEPEGIDAEFLRLIGERAALRLSGSTRMAAAIRWYFIPPSWRPKSPIRH